MSSANDNLVDRDDDDDIEPQERYSSSDVVIAAEEIKFKQSEKKKVVEAKVAAGKISKAEGDKELSKGWYTMAHTLKLADLEKEFNSDREKGLTAKEADRLLKELGPNELTPPKHDPWWLRLLKSIFGGFFNVLLWFGSVLCFIAYGIDDSDIKDPTNLYLGVVLAVVVTLTGIFGYYQESKSADLMGSLSRMKPKDVTCTRDGIANSLDPVNLVPGDIVNLTTGMALPADLRVVKCSPDLEVDNSSLTGESDALKREWKPCEDTPAESSNLCFFGTLIVNGTGRAMVIATGDNTFMGRTAKLATDTKNEDTPIAKEIKDFVFKVSLIAFVLGISFFIIGMVETQEIVPNVVFLIGIIVANVPEGLLATVTVSLTLTARRMFDKNVRVKNLESVETLGSTSVICSDKTGTLTTNVMTCQHVFFDMEERECDTDNPMMAVKGDFYSDPPINKTRKGDFLKLIRCGGLCNNASFLPSGEINPESNATEAAMVKFSAGHISSEYTMSIPDYREKHSKLHEIPFNSKNKWQVSVHKLPADMMVDCERKMDDMDVRDADAVALVQMKGAPERILDLCDRYMINDEVRELDQAKRDEIMAGNAALGSRGERVLALAELLLDPKKFDITVPEPVIEAKYDDEVDESCTDGVIVMYEGNKTRVTVDARNPETNAPIPWNETLISHVLEAIEKELNVPMAAQRLGFSDFKHRSDSGSIEKEMSLEQVGIQKGSLVHLMIGPYIFSGTKKEEVNWPFRRKLGDDKREAGLVFVGLYAMIDPPRPGVPEAVKKCQSAGIKVVMVTGDHPVTAQAIAGKVNIIGPGSRTRDQVADEKYGGDESRVGEDEYSAVVVPGSELQKVLNTQQEDPQGVEDFWNRVLNKDNCVFARTSPKQKLLIVQACRERGGIVAVTGDGVNDSPALKRADIGVAMGITGTEVAKEAADMILLDDNFASIVNGVEEGRIIFDNLKKSIAYTLSSNIPEIAPFLLFQTISIPLPLSTVMILLVDLGTDLAPAISMAYEGKEADIMDRPPRNPDIHKLVTWRLVSFAYLQIGMLQAIAGFYAYFTVLHGFGFRPGHLVFLDQYRVFNEARKTENLRDAYYLWCFDPDISATCQYMPNMYWDDYTDGDDAIDYYYDSEFQTWIGRSGDYVSDAKDWLVSRSSSNAWSSLDLASDTELSNNACQGTYTDDSDATVSVDLEPTDLEDLLNGNLVETVGDTDYEVTVTWETFERCFWKSDPTYASETGLFYMLSADSFKSETSAGMILFPNRRCMDQDYSELWRENEDTGNKLDNANPPFCNNDASTYPNKPRTWSIDSGDYNAERSLFPMGTRTRVQALAHSNSAYFISIIIVQWADLMICKTRIRSLFEQGMTNTFMNYSLFFETILGAFLVYVPVSNQVTGTAPLRFVWWTAGVPFSLMIYIYDEVRKGWIRKNQGGWIHRNTYW